MKSSTLFVIGSSVRRRFWVKRITQSKRSSFETFNVITRGLFNYQVTLDLVRGEYLPFEIMTRNVNINAMIHW